MFGYDRHMLWIRIASIRFWFHFFELFLKTQKTSCELWIVVAWILCDAKGNQVTCWR